MIWCNIPESRTPLKKLFIAIQIRIGLCKYNSTKKYFESYVDDEHHLAIE